MEKRTLFRKDLQQLTRLTTFVDNGDVDYSNSVICCDNSGNILAAIIVGNVTNHPTLGGSIPNEVSDEKGSAQVLLLYIDNVSSYGYLYELLRDFLGCFIPFKVLWCSESEYTPRNILEQLGFKSFISGIAKTYYMMIN